MKSHPSGSSDLEQMIGNAAVEVAGILIRATKKIFGDLTGEDTAMGKARSASHRRIGKMSCGHGILPGKAEI